MVKAFKRSLANDVPRNLSRVQKFVGKDEARQRQFKKYGQQIEDVRNKWERSKVDIEKNANQKFAVMVQSSLGYFAPDEATATKALS